MKKMNIFIVLSILLSILQCSFNDNLDLSIRAMTFNIRLNVQSDSLNAWPYRKQIVANMIQFHHADLIGVQEALIGQVEDLAEHLPNYSWFGLGRDDGDKSGEFMAIFYLKERFKVLRNSTFWLSENPEIPGKGWDAACNRVVTWGKFKDTKTSKIFYHFNTHFDHRGEIARTESAKLLLKQINEIAGISNVIVTGDFNTNPSSIPYKILTDHKKQETDLKLVDAKMVSYYPHHGPTGTFTGFRLANIAINIQPIDYIFVTKNIKIMRHGTLSDTFNGSLPSDHMPVLAEIIIE